MKRTGISLLIIYFNLILAYIILATLDKDFISIQQLFSNTENVLSLFLLPLAITVIGYLVFLLIRFIVKGVIKLVRK